ncbi:NAD P-binding protein [Gloeophyllum trabeum ATCC 11539]|uniref:NAD P-binding protein n=1 Tax=Gloeophyllum trabeum (strain ATCC 11539 / FP-39264 / Madison 617) TaxID=670483 RepID=S7RPQ4_GLOTA|nr:NAD P-binding protein [Gloeophyllum trabeum ATCC 11539]EPQ56540.1 NAD P-binding protein [Gloeophyllum trabeum ATCC 11539]
MDLSDPPDDLFHGLDSDARRRVKFWKTDVTSAEDIQAGVDGAVRWCEETGAHLGGVICSAGVGGAAKIIDSHGNPHSLDLWNFILSINITGTFNLIRLALPHMVKLPPEGPDGERGVIIMVSSSAAFEGQPGQTAYAATKGAIRSMTLPLARDLGRYGIRVVSIAPGAFESSMTKNFPEKTRKSLTRDLPFPSRFGKPEEFAQTVQWIIECPYVNGETVRLSAAGRMPGKL